jgi:hypothetical protein
MAEELTPTPAPAAPTTDETKHELQAAFATGSIEKLAMQAINIVKNEILTIFHCSVCFRL